MPSPLPFDRSTVEYLFRLLGAERRRCRTRRRPHPLTPFRQAVLVLRWFVDGTRIAQLALDNAVSKRTCYRDPHEGIDVLTAQAPRWSRPSPRKRQAIATSCSTGHSSSVTPATSVRLRRAWTLGCS
ncbi:hypothetical protein [Streptomyces sp. NPDC001658]